MANGITTTIKPQSQPTIEHFLVVSLNYKSISLKSLSKFAVSDSGLQELIHQLKSKTHINEIAGIRTCNRLEFFATTQSIEYAENVIFDTLAKYFDCSYHFIVENSFHHSDNLALRHLFRLVSGLESMVVGDAQIFGQVKQGYQNAIEDGCAHKVLHTIFQKAFATAKAVRTFTGLGKGRISISSLAVEYAQNHIANIHNCTATVIGAGKMGVLTVKYLKEANVKEIRIVNRTVEKCSDLADEYGASIHPFEDLERNIEQSDIVFSTTAAQEPIITHTQIEAIAKRSPRTRMFIDITMPCDIETTIGKIEKTTLVSLSEIQELAKRNQERRMAELEKAEEIVEQKLHEIGSWPVAMQIDTIAKNIGDFADRIYQQEIDALFESLPELSENQRDIIRIQMQRVAERIILAPRRALRKTDSHQVSPEALQMLGDIFQKDTGTRSNGRI